MKQLAIGLCAAVVFVGSAVCPLVAAPVSVRLGNVRAIRTNVPAAAADDGTVANVPDLRDVRDLGRAPEARPVSIAVTLAYHHERELQRLVEAQGDPASPYFHRFLTNAQFANYFAPTPADEARVIESLQRGGFTIVNRFTNRTVVDAIAPAARVERYFATELHRVRALASDGGEHVANVRPATAPHDVRGLIATVTGLTDVIHMHTDLERASAFERASARHAALTRIPRGSPLLAVPGKNVLLQSRVRLIAQALPLATATPSPKPTTKPTTTPSPKPTPKPTAKPSPTPSPKPTATPTPKPTTSPGTGNVIVDTGFESGAFGQGWAVCAAYSATNPAITTAKPHTGKYSAFMGSTSSTSGEVDGTTGVCQPLTVPTSGKLSFWVYQYSNEPNTTNAYQEADLLDGAENRVEQLYKTVATTNGWKQLTFDLSNYAGKRFFLYAGVVGNGSSAHSTYQYVDDVTMSGSSFPATGTAIGGPLLGPDDGYGPAVTAIAYDAPVQHGYDGSGRATAVVISGDFSGSDLFTYLDEFGITRGGTVQRVEVDGGAPFTSGSGSNESTLDVETITSLAPSTQLHMYLMPDLSDQHIEDAYDRVVSDNVVDVVNSSFGGCETANTTFTKALEQIVTQGAAKGITFNASSGDLGSAVCSGKTGVQSPASVPGVVAVGGTTLDVEDNGTYASETAWKGSGGGVSTVFTRPSYQSGLTGVTGSGRNVPDVAFAADPATGTSEYFDGEWEGPIGGTSWASPIFSAMQTETDQRHNSRFGYVDPAIYTTHTKYASSAFHDITSGSNGAFSAHSGYDDVTGLGSLKADYFSGVE